MNDTRWRSMHLLASEAIIASATLDDRERAVDELGTAIDSGQQALEAARTVQQRILSQGLINTAVMMRIAR